MLIICLIKFLPSFDNRVDILGFLSFYSFFNLKSTYIENAPGTQINQLNGPLLGHEVFPLTANDQLLIRRIKNLNQRD